MITTSNVLSHDLAENGDELAHRPASASGPAVGEAVTALLGQWGAGDPQAFDALMPLVYRQLRDLAAHYLRQERGNHTLQPTALVHEAYLRLAGIRRIPFRNRAHFYGAAAQVMRRILVDYARERRALKRGGPEPDRVPFDEALGVAADDRFDLVALDEALSALERQIGQLGPAREHAHTAVRLNQGLVDLSLSYRAQQARAYRTLGRVETAGRTPAAACASFATAAALFAGLSGDRTVAEDNREQAEYVGGRLAECRR